MKKKLILLLLTSLFLTPQTQPKFDFSIDVERDLDEIVVGNISKGILALQLLKIAAIFIPQEYKKELAGFFGHTILGEILPDQLFKLGSKLLELNGNIEKLKEERPYAMISASFALEGLSQLLLQEGHRPIAHARRKRDVEGFKKFVQENWQELGLSCRPQFEETESQDEQKKEHTELMLKGVALKLLGFAATIASRIAEPSVNNLMPDLHKNIENRLAQADDQSFSQKAGNLGKRIALTTFEAMPSTLIHGNSSLSLLTMLFPDLAVPHNLPSAVIEKLNKTTGRQKVPADIYASFRLERDKDGRWFVKAHG